MTRLLVALVLACTIIACAKDSPERIQHKEALRKAQLVARRADQARDFLNSMSFVRDSRLNPPLCYAYRWAPPGTSHYGPYSMVVPCERIPPELLVEPSGPLKTSLD